MVVIGAPGVSLIPFRYSSTNMVIKVLSFPPLNITSQRLKPRLRICPRTLRLRAMLLFISGSLAGSSMGLIILSHPRRLADLFRRRCLPVFVVSETYVIKQMGSREKVDLPRNHAVHCHDHSNAHQD